MKKIHIYFGIIVLILTIIYISFFLCFSKKNNLENIKNNTIKIVKQNQIIKNSSNPKGLFLKDKNIKENILSGFFIEKDKLITANHGLNGENINYKIITKDEGILNGKIFKIEKENDIAFLKANSNLNNFNKIKIGKKPKTQDIVFSFYYDKNHNPILKKGKILKIKNGKVYSNIDFSEGESGSALLNKNYEIIGINLEVDIKNNIGISGIIEKY